MEVAPRSLAEQPDACTPQRESLREAEVLSLPASSPRGRALEEQQTHAADRYTAAALGRPRVRHLAAAQPSSGLVWALSRAAFVAWRGYAAAARLQRRKADAVICSMRRLRVSMQKFIAERLLRDAWAAWRSALLGVRLRACPRPQAPELRKPGRARRAHDSARHRSRDRTATTVSLRPVPAA
mmetsp:Transcript_93211/g.287649  ORF Transcript_93211/g.287649 Transcript_93211/m.287649 type:complete len:183 (-) Transcript_93211:267-815(-)